MKKVTLRTLIFAAPLLLASSGKGLDLHQYARCGIVEAVEQELDNKVPVDARDEQGRTALHWAAEFGNTEVIVFLLERGAQKDLEDGEGNTPEYLARWAGHHGAFMLLYTPGADPRGNEDGARAAADSDSDSDSYSDSDGDREEFFDDTDINCEPDLSDDFLEAVPNLFERPTTQEHQDAYTKAREEELPRVEHPANPWLAPLGLELI